MKSAAAESANEKKKGRMEGRIQLEFTAGPKKGKERRAPPPTSNEGTRERDLELREERSEERRGEEQGREGTREGKGTQHGRPRGRRTKHGPGDGERRGDLPFGEKAKKVL